MCKRKAPEVGKATQIPGRSQPDQMSSDKWSSATTNRPMLSAKRDFALGMSNFLSCWETEGTPVAVAMSSLLRVACPVEKAHLATADKRDDKSTRQGRCVSKAPSCGKIK